MILAKYITFGDTPVELRVATEAWQLFDDARSEMIKALDAYRMANRLGDPSMRHVLPFGSHLVTCSYVDLVDEACNLLISGRACWLVCNYEPDESIELWTVDATDGSVWGC